MARERILSDSRALYRHGAWGVLCLAGLLNACADVLRLGEVPAETTDASNDVTSSASTDAAATQGKADAAHGSDGGQGGEVDCGSLAVVQNCGACGNDCSKLSNVVSDSAACTDGRCTYQCMPDTADCADAGGGCTTSLASTSSCGSCGVQCADAAAPLCGQTDASAYACTNGCSAVQTDCGGTCVDLSANPNNCGGCGQACGSGEVCDAGTCGCPAGTILCAGSCVDVMGTDTGNCGGCGNSCAALPHVSNSGLSCVDGTCLYSCATGYADCTTTHMGCATALGTIANCSVCGATCSGSTPACEATGTGIFGCVSGCSADEVSCSGTCSTLSDNNNCGTCGNACSPAEGCSGGVCSCPTAFPTFCSATATCVNTQSDNSNCGACRTVCPAAEKCSMGTCACPTAATPTFCSETDTCVNLQSDSSNCGACGNKCPVPSVGSATALCTAGACTFTCTAPTPNLCSGNCVDLSTDSANCGVCAHSCTVGTSSASCQSSVCPGVLVASATHVIDMRSDQTSVFFLDGAANAVEQCSASTIGAAITLTPAGGVTGLTNITVDFGTSPTTVGMTVETASGTTELWNATAGSAGSAAFKVTVGPGKPYGLSSPNSSQFAHFAVENAGAYTMYDCDFVTNDGCLTFGNPITSSQPGSAVQDPGCGCALSPFWTDVTNGIVYGWSSQGAGGQFQIVTQQPGATDLTGEPPGEADDVNMYWVDANLSLQEAPFAQGPEPPNTLATVGTVLPANLATDGQFVYWVGAIGGVNGVYYVPVTGGTPAMLALHDAPTGVVLLVAVGNSLPYVLFYSDDEASQPGIYKVNALY